MSRLLLAFSLLLCPSVLRLADWPAAVLATCYRLHWQGGAALLPVLVCLPPTRQTDRLRKLWKRNQSQHRDRLGTRLSRPRHPLLLKKPLSLFISLASSLCLRALWFATHAHSSIAPQATRSVQ
jgi:hypothetical protein